MTAAPGLGPAPTSARLPEAGAAAHHRAAGTVVAAALGVLAVVLMARQLTGSNVLGAVLGAVSGAGTGWVVVAAAASVLPLLGAAASLTAFTPGPVPRGDAVAVQLASGFVTVVTPPTVGQLAVNARFLRRLGHPLGTVTAVVGLTQLSSLAVSLVLLAGALAQTGTALPLTPSPVVLAVAGVVALTALALVALPGPRRRVVDAARRALPDVGHQLRDAVLHPRRLAVGLSGSLLLSAGYIATLDASLRAFGVSVPLAATAVVLLAGNTLGSAAPTPAGVGAVEAALTAGLVAAGVPATDAVCAVLLHRTLTVWVRVAPGWAALVLLRRRGVL